MSDGLVDVVMSVLLCGFVVAFLLIAFFAGRRKQDPVEARELKRLKEEALEMVAGLPSASEFATDVLVMDVDMYSHHADVLRAMIRFVPSHPEFNVAEAVMALHVGRESGMELSLTGDDFTVEHFELYEVLQEAWRKRERLSAGEGVSERSRQKAWLAAKKDTCFALEHLRDYPMILPVVRDRGILDIEEMLEAAREMAACEAPSLSSGML